MSKEPPLRQWNPQRYLKVRLKQAAKSAITELGMSRFGFLVTVRQAFAQALQEQGGKEGGAK